MIVSRTTIMAENRAAFEELTSKLFEKHGISKKERKKIEEEAREKALQTVSKTESVKVEELRRICKKDDSKEILDLDEQRLANMYYGEIGDEMNRVLAKKEKMSLEEFKERLNKKAKEKTSKKLGITEEEIDKAWNLE